jgi:Xaa-Pro dipeptidase
MTPDKRRTHLKTAEQHAEALFREIEKRNLIRPHVSEKLINTDVYNLAFELFGIKKYWHKRIVRAGPNTLFPYRENPPDRIVREDDILFLDFGPIFEEWEADFGRTYVLGTDELKWRLKADVERLWKLGKDFFDSCNGVVAKELFNHVYTAAADAGYSWGSVHCGHLIGQFPHENIPREQFSGFIHAENDTILRSLDDRGCERHWILEVHITIPEKEIGAFHEQLLSV